MVHSVDYTDPIVRSTINARNAKETESTTYIEEQSLACVVADPKQGEWHHSAGMSKGTGQGRASPSAVKIAIGCYVEEQSRRNGEFLRSQ